MVWLYAAMQVAHSAMRSDLVYRVLGYAEFRNTFILLLFPRWCAKPRGVKCKSGVTGVSWGFWTALRVHLIVTESH
jgi:hypothetical protein